MKVIIVALLILMILPQSSYAAGDSCISIEGYRFIQTRVEGTEPGPEIWRGLSANNCYVIEASADILEHEINLGDKTLVLYNPFPRSEINDLSLKLTCQEGVSITSTNDVAVRAIGNVIIDNCVIESQGTGIELSGTAKLLRSEVYTGVSGPTGLLVTVPGTPEMDLGRTAVIAKDNTEVVDTIITGTGEVGIVASGNAKLHQVTVRDHDTGFILEDNAEASSSFAINNFVGFQAFKNSIIKGSRAIRNTYGFEMYDDSTLTTYNGVLSEAESNTKIGANLGHLSKGIGIIASGNNVGIQLTDRASLANAHANGNIADGIYVNLGHDISINHVFANNNGYAGLAFVSGYGTVTDVKAENNGAQRGLATIIGGGVQLFAHGGPIIARDIEARNNENNIIVKGWVDFEGTNYACQSQEKDIVNWLPNSPRHFGGVMYTTNGQDTDVSSSEPVSFDSLRECPIIGDPVEKIPTPCMPDATGGCLTE